MIAYENEPMSCGWHSLLMSRSDSVGTCSAEELRRQAAELATVLAAKFAAPGKDVTAHRPFAETLFTAAGAAADYEMAD